MGRGKQGLWGRNSWQIGPSFAQTPASSVNFSRQVCCIFIQTWNSKRFQLVSLPLFLGPASRIDVGKVFIFGERPWDSTYFHFRVKDKWQCPTWFVFIPSFCSRTVQAPLKLNQVSQRSPQASSELGISKCGSFQLSHNQGLMNTWATTLCSWLKTNLSQMLLKSQILVINVFFFFFFF